MYDRLRTHCHGAHTLNHDREELTVVSRSPWYASGGGENVYRYELKCPKGCRWIQVIDEDTGTVYQDDVYNICGVF